MSKTVKGYVYWNQGITFDQGNFDPQAPLVPRQYDNAAKSFQGLSNFFGDFSKSGPYFCSQHKQYHF